MRSAPWSRSRILPLLAVMAVAGGCIDSSTAVESGPIEGEWVSDASNGALFLLITPDSLIYYTALDAEDCADRYAYELTPVGGNDYLLDSSVNFATIESTITQVDDELTWRTAFGGAVFQRSAVDPAALDVCAGGGDDPAVTCASLPALLIGEDVQGVLETDDAAERGRFYDLYALQPATPLTPGEITVRSIGFDPYLYLYDDGGTLLTENDDAVEGSLDAGLTLPLNPVCYRVEVTTVQDGGSGAYTLRVD